MARGDSKNIVKNTVMLLIMNMAKLVFPLFTLPYLTRILTTNLYGSVSYVKAVMEKMSSQNAGIAWWDSEEITSIVKEHSEKTKRIFQIWKNSWRIFRI